jgi:hypothetical protein
MVVHDRVFPLKGKQYHGAWEYKEELPESTITPTGLPKFFQYPNTIIAK